ncbi:class I SAM-dependent methyltransferase [Desulforamulus aquiferis]|uniref:Class I SAM-dependent methyltransferase n=1 Tax=Desulforamulus aquiferis TaxID=1397668 RepID=A0AAW7ZD70_9FIRM|nr:class I SAM-dependent methyltransferase [Desulforamulus aquiferis]
MLKRGKVFVNNTWNKVIYKIWSPIYDSIFKGLFFNVRKQIFNEISFKKEDKILFVGVGTGADIELIDHDNLDITAIDFSPDMLNKARAKFNISSVNFLEMDAQDMNFKNESFDYVFAHLVLSVVPNADKCFQEMVRVLKPEGKIIIFDKFAPKNKQLSLPKKLLRPIIGILGTDIGLNFEKIYYRNNQKLKIEEDVPAMLNGMYRKIIIRKI